MGCGGSVYDESGVGRAIDRHNGEIGYRLACYEIHVLHRQRVTGAAADAYIPAGLRIRNGYVEHQCTDTLHRYAAAPLELDRHIASRLDWTLSYVVTIDRTVTRPCVEET